MMCKHICILKKKIFKNSSRTMTVYRRPIANRIIKLCATEDDILTRKLIMIPTFSDTN